MHYFFFHLGDYDRALCSLKKLHVSDTSIAKAIMQIEVFFNPDCTENLAQIDMSNTFEKEE